MLWLISQRSLLPGIVILGGFILFVLWLVGLIVTSIEFWGPTGNVNTECNIWVVGQNTNGVSIATLAWLEQHSICKFLVFFFGLFSALLQHFTHNSPLFKRGADVVVFYSFAASGVADFEISRPELAGSICVRARGHDLLVVGHDHVVQRISRRLGNCQREEVDLDKCWEIFCCICIGMGFPDWDGSGVSIGAMAMDKRKRC